MQPRSLGAEEDLSTPRLRLEALEPRHASALFDGLQSARLYEFIADAPPTSIQSLRDRYALLARRCSPDGTERWLNWAIFHPAEQRYLGYVQATVSARGEATIAYLLFPEDWGMGYAYEAVIRMCEHLVEAYEVTGFRASADTRNRRSIALLERLGFTRIRVRKDAEMIRGVLSDEAEYWKPASP